LILWVVWVAATLPGFLAGALVPEPRRFGLDLLMPIFFSAMLVPLWKGVRPALPWAVAGCVALIVQWLSHTAGRTTSKREDQIWGPM